MRISVLGCGSIGRRHLRNLLALGYDDLIAFDPDQHARETAAAELRSVEIFANLESVWQHQPKVAFITSPPDFHVDLALASARRGCHIFIEKPLSHSLEGVQELADEVERHALISMVGCNMRYHPGPATIKKLLKEEAIGLPIHARLEFGSFLPRWRPWQNYRQSYSASPESGGAILDCIHEIDLALWYFGPAVIVATAQQAARSIDLETDGLAEILMSHDCGVLTSLHLNFVQRDYHRGCQIIGTEGTIRWHFVDHAVKLYGSDGRLNTSVDDPADWELNQMYLDEIQDFLNCVRTGRSTINPLTGGLAALQIALAARNFRSVVGA